ncbi:hypothetical protein [Microcoleus phage My-WqHQDG]|nr:hypothetical protein [Microcoleus phage My-WqHQDG]
MLPLPQPTMTTAITTGLCATSCCTNTSTPLITTTYKEGAGDKGYTATSPTTRGEKADNTLVKLWVRLSKLQVCLKKTIPYFKDDDTRTCLYWIWENVRSLSSLAYLEGATDTHAFPPIAIAYMERMIAERKVEMGSSISFIQWEHPDLLEMEDLWTEVRDTETMYREWVSTADIVLDSVSHKVDTVLSLLNRLSSYLWWVMRHENKLRGCKELVWQGHVTPFPFSV